MGGQVFAIIQNQENDIRVFVVVRVEKYVTINSVANISLDLIFGQKHFVHSRVSLLFDIIYGISWCGARGRRVCPRFAHIYI